MTDLSTNHAETRICSKCKIEQNLKAGFHRDRSQPSGYRFRCRQCMKKQPKPPRPLPRLEELACSQCGLGVDQGAIFGYRNKAAEHWRTECSACLKIRARNIREANKARNASRPEVRPGDQERKCEKCGVTQDLATGFHPDPETSTGYRWQCRACRNGRRRERLHADPELLRRHREHNARWVATHKEYLKAYRQANHDRELERSRRYRAAHRDLYRRSSSKRYWRDPNKARQELRKSYRRHREKRLQANHDRYYRDIQKTRFERRQYYRKNRDVLARSAREFRARHLDRINEYDRQRGLVRQPLALDMALDLGGKRGRPFGDGIADRTAVDPADVMTRQEKAVALDWLSSLPADDRRLMEAYADSGLDIAATADALGLSVAVAQTRLETIQGEARKALMP